MYLEDLVREKCGGVYEGQPLTVFRELASQSKVGLRKFKPDGGECWEDVH